MFYEPALDMLWSNLNTMAPLVMCLPRDAWRIKNKVLCLTRALEHKDWLRYLFHARRVKSIGIEHGTTTSEFKFRLHPDTSAILLPILPRTCPSLVHLDICSSIEPPTAIVASSAVMFADDQLQTLAINATLFEEALIHLGHLTKLRTLEIHRESRVTVGDDDDSLKRLTLSRLPRRGHLFPALQNLLFSASSLYTCTNFIRSTWSRKLELLSLIVDRSLSDNSEDDDASQLFSLLGSEDNTYPLLTHISIRHLQPVHKVHAIHVLYQYFPKLTSITSTTLQPLLTRSNLTVLDINPLLCSFDLDDGFLFLMATSWPSLQTLFLGHIFGWHSTSNITLDGLVPLVAYCPDLQNLGIVVDATLDPTPFNDDGPINDKITCLHLGDSKPSSDPYPSHVAQFLSDLFPGLLKIHVSPPNAPNSRAWGTIEDMVLQLGEFGAIASMGDM